MRTKNPKNYTLENKGEIAVLITVNKGKSHYYPYDQINEYLEVNAHFDNSKLQIKKWREEEEWTYRSLTHKNDTLARWVGRNNAINYVGESAIIEAEKQVKRNVRRIRKEIKEARLNPIWLTLKPIADDTIQHYESDFYYNDCLIINNEKPDKFIWMIRNTGTWLIYHKHSFNDCIITEEEKKVKYNKPEHKNYYWNGSKLTEIDINKVKELYNRMESIQ